MKNRHPELTAIGTIEAMRQGSASEARFMEAFEVPRWTPPEWYRSIRHANAAEDADGYDFFIDTTSGEVPIQVKCSTAYIARYWLRHPRSTALLIVVNGSDSYQKIRDTILKQVKDRIDGNDFSILSRPPWSVPNLRLVSY